jgi:hypothetical protein
VPDGMYFILLLCIESFDDGPKSPWDNLSACES